MSDFLLIKLILLTNTGSLFQVKHRNAHDNGLVYYGWNNSLNQVFGASLLIFKYHQALAVVIKEELINHRKYETRKRF